ncbi:MAG: outer membrane lipoprotein-sorting protein, partial [Halobacteriovoraceae bacterium]|nr:outer membrane lipoprotein-sorting protein [Halobacteriovoraceae bacterium]
KSSDQFIYLPSQKKERRISSSKKNGRFVKSDYYYEDLADRVPSKDTHKMLSDGKYEGTDCYKLESIPVDKHESAYSKKVACIDKKTFIPLHVNLYNKKGELSKELKVKAIEEIDGLLFITQSVLENKEKKSKTILLVNDIKSNDNSIKDSLFSRDQLKL